MLDVKRYDGWPTAKRRSQNIKIALLVDLLNVVDQAAVGSAPNMTLLTIDKVKTTSGSSTPAHAANGMLEPGTGRNSQWVFAFGRFVLLFVAKRMIIWMAAIPE